MTRGAKRDQVLFGVVAGVTPKLFVMDFKVRHRATGWTPPAVATQDLLTQTFVRQGIQPRGSGFWGESFSGCLLTQVFEESLLLFAGQELVVARDRVEQ